MFQQSRRQYFSRVVSLAVLFTLTASFTTLYQTNPTRRDKFHSLGWEELFQRSMEDSFKKQKNVTGSQVEEREFTLQSRIVYNKVGKCGSRTMLGLIDELARRNGFALHGSNIGNETHIPLKGQIELVNTISALKRPFVFHRHFHYIDFEKFGAIQPVYINVIRDPISRFTSQYYFKRFGDDISTKSYKGDGINMTINECVLSENEECSEKKLFYITPFFCGQDKRCRTPSDWALEKAISNLAERYLVVGFIEDIAATLQVLEELLPDMFMGAAQLQQQTAAMETMRSQTTTKGKIPPTEEVHNIMRQRMYHEYRFYNFAKQQFSVIKRQLGIQSPVR